VADPFETLVDYLVYVPLGAALTMRDMIPSLIEQGRERGEQQVALARVVGQFAVKVGRAKAEKEWAGLVERATSRNATPATDLAPDAGSGPAASVGAGGVLAERPLVERPLAEQPSAETNTEIAAAAPIDGSAIPSSAADALAIHDYDYLAASQIVARLGDLGDDELDAIEAYERANRNRRTVLGRIQQLRSYDRPS
jgi:hypothetical protein